MLDANFLFHGTWLEIYEHSMEYLKLYVRKILGVVGNGLDGRAPKPKASAAARYRRAAGQAEL